MKKKTKLFTTIASLCLAVALMAFGVYAATTSTLTVTSNVSFTSNNVAVTYTANVAVSSRAAVEVSNDFKSKLEADVVDTASEATWTESHTADKATADTTFGLGDYSFTDAARTTGESGADKITYTYTIHNDGEKALTVTVDKTPTVVTSGAILVAVNAPASATIAKGATYTYTVTVTLNAINVDVNKIDVGVKFTVKNA